MNNIKPIFCIGLPYIISMEMKRTLNESPELIKLRADYHVLIFANRSDSITFQLFNADNANDINIAELEKHLESLIRDRG